MFYVIGMREYAFQFRKLPRICIQSEHKMRCEKELRIHDLKSGLSGHGLSGHGLNNVVSVGLVSVGLVSVGIVSVGMVSIGMEPAVVSVPS